MRIAMLNGGVGVVASSRRNILPGNEFDLYFPKPEYTDPILASDGNNDQTLDKFIPQVVKQCYGDTSKIALVLKRESIEATVHAIWNFCYTYIQYKLDNPWQEEIRRPARSWADRKTGIDCDCYTVFISSILTNIRIPHTIRMAAYKKDRGYQHVYVVVPKKVDSNLNKIGDYFTIDPVMDAFNSEKPYLYKKDKVLIPSRQNQSGLNGFPIRMLNGNDHVFAAKSKFVHPQVYYSEGLKQWALKGIDGAYYLQGDPGKRFIEPVNGLGFVLTALSAGTALWKNRKAIASGFKGLKKKKKRKQILIDAKNLVKSVIPVQEIAQSVLPVQEIAQSVLSTKGMVQRVLPTKKMVQSVLPVQGEVSSMLSAFLKDNVSSQKAMQLNTMVSMDKVKADLNQSLKASNYATMVSMDKVKTDLNQSAKASNYAAVLSMDNLNKGQIQNFNSVFGKLEELKKSAANSGTLHELLQKAVSITAGSQSQAQEIKDTQEKESKKNDSFRQSLSTTNKVIIAGLVGLAILIIILMVRKKV